MARRDVGRGPSPPAGPSLSSAAASINFNISAGNGVAEALEGSSMQKKDCIPASNLSLNKVSLSISCIMKNYLNLFSYLFVCLFIDVLQ